MEQYHFMIYEQEVSLISYMAEVVKQNVETVTNELNRMAALGRLPDAYVHMPTCQVILTNKRAPRASFSETNNLTINLAAELMDWPLRLRFPKINRMNRRLRRKRSSASDAAPRRNCSMASRKSTADLCCTIHR